jgi:hypothetical protein
LNIISSFFCGYEPQPLIKPEKELPVSPPPLKFNVAKERAHYMPMQEKLNAFSIWSFFGKGGERPFGNCQILSWDGRKTSAFLLGEVSFELDIM